LPGVTMRMDIRSISQLAEGGGEWGVPTETRSKEFKKQTEGRTALNKSSSNMNGKKTEIIVLRKKKRITKDILKKETKGVFRVSWEGGAPQKPTLLIKSKKRVLRKDKLPPVGI